MCPLPEKRTIKLVLLSLFVYFLSYCSVGTSLELVFVAVDPLLLSDYLFGTKFLGENGRYSAELEDRLEKEIFGDWEWRTDRVVGSGKLVTQPKGSDRHGAMWTAPEASALDKMVYKDNDTKLGYTVNDVLQRWGNDFPITRVVKHAPGYNILDNVYIFNGSVYLVTDAIEEFPQLSKIVISKGLGFQEWKIISSADALTILGSLGAPIRGVTWMSADTSPHNSTLFALWRLYSSLDLMMDEKGITNLPAPARLIFPHIPFFRDNLSPPILEYWRPRERADTGFHPYLAKSSFPQLAVQYYEDWEDYQKIGMPFFFERLVIADRSAARSNIDNDLPVYSPAFEMEVSKEWWLPVWKNISEYLGLITKPSDIKTITYLHTQSGLGQKLSRSDHLTLVHGLEDLARGFGYNLNIISIETSETSWVDKMSAVLRSSVVLSVHGDHLMESLFMRPTAQSTVMEFYPAGKFVRDREFAVRSIGMRYVAWQGSLSYENDLPLSSPPENDENIMIDVPAVIQTIQKYFSGGQ